MQFIDCDDTKRTPGAAKSHTLRDQRVKDWKPLESIETIVLSSIRVLDSRKREGK